MPDRPYTVLSCGMSIDGYIDAVGVRRLQLSNDADFDRVDDVRAGCDAILVGAATIRQDNPRLLVRSPVRRAERISRGLGPSPTKVTVTASGKLDPGSDFFVAGDGAKLVYCASDAFEEARTRFLTFGTVIDAGSRPQMRWVSEDLYAHGVRRLLVEGGGSVHTEFLTGELADELQLVVAPVFVGDSRASRFVGDGRFPWNPSRRARLLEVRHIGDVALLRYALSERCS